MIILDLLKKTTSLETFLLCSAALANLSSLLPLSLPTLTSASLLPVLLLHPASSSASVYIQDQVVTVLANLAKVPAARTQILGAGGVTALVRTLSTGCPDPRDPALVAATERTVSKAAIALARLCLEPASADQVVRVGGLDRLLELARGAAGPADTVKIAAMAAIKTVTVYCSARLELDLEEVEGVEGGNKGCGYYTTETPISSLESFV